MKPKRRSSLWLKRCGHVASILLCCAAPCLSPGSSSADSIDDTRQVRQLVQAGAILPLEYFIEKARELHPGRVIDASLDHEEHHGGYVYEVEILDLYGQIWEIEFNAATGRLVEKELGGDER
jgi:uncharacterized membrane protein YkoI